MTLNSLNTFQDLGVDLAPLVIRAVMEFLVLVWTLLQGKISCSLNFHEFFQQIKTRFTTLFCLYLIFIAYFSSKTNLIQFQVRYI